MTVRSISVQLSASIGNYVTNMKQAGQATRVLGGELETLAATSKTKFNDVMKASTVVSVGMLGIVGAVVAMSTTFDKQMSEVQAVSNATAAQMGTLRSAAIEAGKDTVFSATDAAKAEAELAKAGLSTAQILGGGLTGALSLASAGSIDLADAATDTAQALNIFGLNGSAASHVADVLSAGANTSATDVSQLAYSLNQAGLVAHQTGLSLEDTVGVLADFAQHGLVGSDAGTSFRTMLQSLQNPSMKTKALMQQLGISAYDAGGNFIGITKLAGVLQTKLSGLTQAQRDAAMAQIFGSDAVRAANVLYTDGAAGIQKWINGVDDSGAASRTAALKMDNLAGDVENLKGSLETLAISSSGGVTKGLRTLTQGTQGLVNQMISLPTPITEAVTVLTGLGGAGTLGATGFVKVRSAGKDLLSTLRDIGPGGEKAATALGKIGSVGGKLGLVGVGAFAAYVGIRELVGYINKESATAHVNIQTLTDDLQAFAETGKISGTLAKIAGGSLDAFATKLSDAIAKYRDLQDVQANVGRIAAANPMLDASEIAARYQAQVGEATHGLNTLLGNIDDIDASLAALVKNGDAADAYKVFNQLDEAMASQGISAAQILEEFPQYTKAAAGAAQANSIAAKSTNTLTNAQGTLVLGMDDSISKGLKLTDVIDSLSGANEDAERSTIDAQQALADLSAALKKNKDQGEKNRTSLKDSTQAGRDNLKMVLGSIDADKKQFQSTYAKKLQTEDQTSALNDATKQYDDYIGRLRRTLTAEGFNAKQVDALIKLYGDIPPVESTQIKTPGLGPAKTAAKDLNTYLQYLDGKNVTVHVHTHYTSSGARPDIASVNRWGGVYTPNERGGLYRHAATGLLNQASVYSPMSPGRYMIAEPSTGGEAFVPRFGDYHRSMQILGQAAAWYGAQVLPRGASTATMAPPAVHTYNTTTNVYPLNANFTERDLMQVQQVQEMRQRIGRPI